MTTYGTIPTSSSPLSSTKNLRSWKLMFNLRSFGVPAGGITAAVSRLRFNAAYFRMNYAILGLLILFLSLLWHPISLIVFIVLMAAWLFLYFLRDQPLVILGHLVDDTVLTLVFMAVLTVVLLLLTQATVNILVAVLVGAVAVVAHAAFRKTEDLFLDEEEGLVTNAYAAFPIGEAT